MTKNIKLAMHTADLSDEKFLALQDLFPEAVTETITTDENGEQVVTRAIDADVLQQLINKKVVSGKEERYQFTWPDKKKAMLLGNAPINKTLRPCREESVDFDNTENLYIEGDNLDVLKLLRETYLGKIKMIYIDPPYNTGNDFVYEDNFAEDTQEFLRRDNQIDDQGNKLVTNTESNGRFHTDWLNMMYPRLKLARDLLNEQGVMLISMADNEISNLLKICEEIFGNSNIEIFVWKKKGGSGNTEKILGVLTEYVVCCFKSKKPHDLNYQIFERVYQYQDEQGPYNLEGIEKTNLGQYERPTMLFDIVDPKTRIVFRPSSEMRWTLGKETIEKYLLDGKLYFDYNSMKVKRIKRESDYEISSNVYYNLLLEEGSLSNAKDELHQLLGNRELFETPKPLLLIKKLLLIGAKRDSLILDFFAGSSTTAHAVMQLNAEDNGNRKFIMVQLPESTDEKSEAFKANYKNICEIGKERIRRAGNKIKEEVGLTTQNLDIGFRVLKLDESNMNNVYYSPEEYKDYKFKFEDLIENIKPDRTHEDILFQVMLELGVPLSAKIKIDDNIITVDGNYLVACFDTVDSDTVTKIAKMQPYYAVFRDSSFINDSSLINVDQIFNTYSPTTKRRVI